MAYGMNPSDLNARQQNIGVLEGARGRALQEQLAAEQAALQRSAQSQQYKMFEEDQAWKDKMAQEAAEQAKQDRLYGLIGGGIGGILGAGGSVLGAGLGQGGFLRK